MVVYFSLLSDRPTDKATRRCEGRACRTEKAIAITYSSGSKYITDILQRILKGLRRVLIWRSQMNEALGIEFCHKLSPYPFFVDFGHTFTLALSSFVLFLPSFRLFVFVLVFVLFSLFFLNFF